MTIQQRKAPLGKTTTSIDEQTRLPDWLMFPALNEAWMQSADGTIALMAERSKTFQELSASAPTAERARARLIAQSYVQVHSVLQELNATSKKIASAERKT
jgi:hypothetical protein